MQATTSFLKTAGVLVALWAILFAVGFGLGAIPPGGEWRPSADAALETDDAGELDAELADAGELDAGVAPAEDAAVDGGAPAVLATEVPTHAVCPEPSVPPSLAVVQLGGDPRPELVVGCGDHWEVLAGEALGRVVRITTPPGDEGLMARAGAPSALDFDADGSADLALPFVRYGAGGATSGGGLYVVRSSGWNVLGEVRAIAPIAAAAVATGAIDGAAGDDLLAVHQANPFARLTSEGWVFSGGASPRRTAVVRAATGSVAGAIVDLDIDGSMDVALASADDGRLDVFFGDGEGRFPRHRSFDVASASGLAVADVNGDAKPDLAVEGAQGGVVLAAREDELAVVPLTGALRGLTTHDLDADGRAEVIGFEPPALVALRRADDGSWERREVLELADASFGVRRQLFADLDGDGAAEVVVLGTRAEGEGRVLEVMVVPSTTRGVIAPTAGAAVADAPWVIDVALPEAQPL